jgi:hypothetical protein
MTSPPLTNREYAYFHVTGPGHHEVITEKLSISPSEAWAEGDPRPRGGLYQFMRWQLNSGHDDMEPLEKHIESLLAILSTRTQALRDLSADYDLTIQCVGYYPASGHGAHLRRDVIKAAAQLCLSFDLDFYYVDDYGHDG